MIESKSAQYDRLERLVVHARKPATRLLALHLLKKNHYDPAGEILHWVREVVA